MSKFNATLISYIQNGVRTFAAALQIGLFCMLIGIPTTQAQSVVTYFHNDVSGSPMVATDAAGNVVWKEGYKPYGEKQRNEVPSRDGKNKIGFAGSPFDASTGLSYMGARYYNPVIGRFMGVDPVGFQENNVHSFNRYAYANNNPYKFVDRDGHSPIDVAFLIYDIGKLGVAAYTGVGVAGAAADVALSTIGVVSPVPGVGQAMKAARVVEHGVGAGSKTIHAIEISASKYPESAKHIQDAIAAGKSSTLTVGERGSSASRRRDALKDTPTKSGKDRDEYPPAMFQEGGAGASVRHISPKDNRGSGACIGAQCRNLSFGDKVEIKVTQ